MVQRLFLLALVAVGLGTDAQAADLAALQRVLAREPAYQGQPRYCLLVFGPEAKTRVWMVRDDRTLYLDRTGTGDLTRPDVKRNVDPGNFTILDLDLPGRKRTNLFLQARGNEFLLELHGVGAAPQYVGAGLMERPSWGDRAENAPILHFDGPRMLTRYGPPVALQREGSPHRTQYLRLMVGTPGLGKGTFVSHDECELSLGKLHADFTWPGADDGKLSQPRCELPHEG